MAPISLSRTWPLALVSLALPLAAQQQGVADTGFVTHPEPTYRGYAPDAPMPPKVVTATLPGHSVPRVPLGPFRPGPNTPEAELVDPAVVDTGQFRFFQNEPVTPSGAVHAAIGEPSIAQTDHVMFQTGNWYAAVSRDNGSSWQSLNPFTFFPSRDGGFCCDQRVLYIPSHDLTVWILQYRYSPASGTAGYRIAVAQGDAELGSGDPADWTSYYLTPQNRFGFGSNVWFDFPDVAYSNGAFYLSANVYDSVPNYRGAVILQTSLSGLQAGGTISWSSINSNAHGLRASPRLAKAGAGDGIHWGCLRNTSSIQVGYLSDAGSFIHSPESIGSISQSITSTPSPDGVNWAARAAERFYGAFGSSTEFGLLCASGPVGTRANPHLRVIRINPYPARTVASEHDIWASTGAWAYGAAATNAQGHVGMVAAFSSSTLHLQTAAGIVDNYQGWVPTFYTAAPGTSSPNQSRWGDYFTVQQHSRYRDTFVATGMSQVGGATDADNVPRAFWFGRDDYEPNWVSLRVESQPAGAYVQVEQTDMNGQRNGNATFTRRFTPNQPYVLTAPYQITSGGQVYLFDRWRYRVSPTGAFVDAPQGDQVLSVSTIGSLDDTAIAVYSVTSRITVTSEFPTSGVSIGVSPPDINGRGGGSTTLLRIYPQGEMFTLTAPSAVGFNTFRHWERNGLRVLGATETVTLPATSSFTMKAVYWDNVTGISRRVGRGCSSSVGLTPSHNVSWPAGENGPQQGSPIQYELLLSGLVGAPAAFNFGFSDTVMGGLSLPLDLSVIGTPGCTLYHDLVTSVGVVTDSSGRAHVTYVWPPSPATIGVPHFTSYVIVDPGNGRPSGLTFTAAHRTTVGGNR